MKIQKVPTIYGTILPNGNAVQFPWIRRNLKRLGIKADDYYEIPLYGGGIVFLFEKEFVKKLPTWERKRFLPATEDGQGGHSIYPITVPMLAHLLDNRWRSRRGREGHGDRTPP